MIPCVAICPVFEWNIRPSPGASVGCGGIPFCVSQIPHSLAALFKRLHTLCHPVCGARSLVPDPEHNCRPSLLHGERALRFRQTKPLATSTPHNNPVPPARGRMARDHAGRADWGRTMSTSFIRKAILSNWLMLTIAFLSSPLLVPLALLDRLHRRVRNHRRPPRWQNRDPAERATQQDRRHLPSFQCFRRWQWVSSPVSITSSTVPDESDG